MNARIGTSLLFALTLPCLLSAQDREATPIRQSELTAETAVVQPLTLRDAARDDRWLGLGVRDIRWAPDGSAVYFRWNRRPAPNDVPDADPWFRTDPEGRWVRELAPNESGDIPAEEISWSSDGRFATWTDRNAVFIYSTAWSPSIRRIASFHGEPVRARVASGANAVRFELAEALYQYDIDSGSLALLALRTVADEKTESDAARWLVAQQRDLFTHIQRQDRIRKQSDALDRTKIRPQPIPVAQSMRVHDIQLSPDGKHVTFHARTSNTRRPATQYIDYVDESGYSRVREARSKVGEPRDEHRLGIVAVNPNLPPDSTEVTWVELAEAGAQKTVAHGPFWNIEGTRAVVQFIGEEHKDLWIAHVDVATGRTTVITHDHDDAWIGGPPIQANYLQPALLEWLAGDRFVFASERSGWSHLYLVEADGSIEALTEGDWEVRDAELSRDRSFWLLQTSREHPADDHLYTLPAAGGSLTRLTDAPGRHTGYLSPNGRNIAVVHSDAVTLPDLFLRTVRERSSERRVTVSGTGAFYAHPLAHPEIVSFAHPDRGPLWAALFRPEQPNAEGAAVLHIHGGGYRQFAHRGWSVYGYDLHLGFINYLLQAGYTVLDFDYRGSAGFGRDYRTDIADAMGIKDADGAAAAARYLVREHGIDSTRIGIYGVSYGGFLTLMSLFRYPGVFAAGIARAPVTDWAHYSDGWTSRILGVPHENAEAYERSSPIYYAEGLRDHLLIEHGLVDDNVHFQDAARLVQRLIELEKAFEVMYYPVEPHTVQTEVSRYDQVKRAAAFFERHLRGR